MTHFREGMLCREAVAWPEEPSDALHCQSRRWASVNAAGDHSSRKPAASLSDSSLCDPRQHGLFTIEEEEEQTARNSPGPLRETFEDSDDENVPSEEDRWANVPLGVAVELAGLEAEPKGTENAKGPAPELAQEEPEQGAETCRTREASPAEQDGSSCDGRDTKEQEGGYTYLTVTIVKDTPRRLLHPGGDPVYGEAALLTSGDWRFLCCDAFESIFGRQKHRRMLYVCPEGDVVYDRKAREVAFRTAAARAEAERDVRSGRRAAPRRYARKRHLEPLWSKEGRYVRDHGLQPVGNRCDWRRSRVADPGNRGPGLVVTDPAGETWCLVPPEWDETPAAAAEDKMEFRVPGAFC